MKKLCILPALLFLSNIVWSQNWMPINSTDKYNYSTGNYHYYASIWADSSEVINQDSVLFLNKIIKKVKDVDEHDWHDFATAYYLENQSQFFLSKIISSVNGDIEMLENDSINYLIKLSANLNDTWVFDSLKGDTATVINLSETVIFGNTDSIKVIKLSGNDTIILSKNYGILKFPIFDTRHQHINLIGIEGRNVGLLIPKFKDFFDFNVGDIFCYQYVSRRHAAYYTEYSKITIKSKAVIGDSVIYSTRFISRMNRIDLGIKDSAFINKDSLMIYIDSENNFLNKYSNQILNSDLVSEKYKPVCVSSKNSILGNIDAITKTYPQNPFEKKSDSDTIIEHRGNLYYPIGMEQEETFSYATNLGLISYYWEYYSSSFYSMDTKIDLIGCVKNGVIHGNLLDDSFFKAGKKPNFNVFPNPVTDVITIKSLKNNANSRFAILNANGRELIGDQITGDEVKVDISSLQIGIYFVKLISDDSVEVKKIVKE